MFPLPCIGMAIGSDGSLYCVNPLPDSWALTRNWNTPPGRSSSVLWLVIGICVDTVTHSWLPNNKTISYYVIKFCFKITQRLSYLNLSYSSTNIPLYLQLKKIFKSCWPKKIIITISTLPCSLICRVYVNEVSASTNGDSHSSVRQPPICCLKTTWPGVSTLSEMATINLVIILKLTKQCLPWLRIVTPFLKLFF